MQVNDDTIYEGYYRYLESCKTQIPIHCFSLDANKSAELPTGILNMATDVFLQLVKRNSKAVINAIENNERDIKRLVEMLGNWESAIRAEDPEISFIGLRITTDCNLYGGNRCAYCNQRQYKNQTIPLEVIRSLSQSASQNGRRRGIRANISGGEPLLLENNYLFGTDGAIPNLYQYGFITNLNTNLQLFSPRDVLEVINSGLTNIHTSFDTSDEEIHDELVAPGAYQQVVKALSFFQIIKGIFEVQYPIIHINIVATKKNIRTLDHLFEYVLSIRNHRIRKGEGNPLINPEKFDLAPHLITVGGESNIDMRPSYEDWENYIQVILPKCRLLWKRFLDKNNIFLKKDLEFDNVFTYMNPFRQSIFEKPLTDSFKIEKLMKENGRDFDNNQPRCYLAPTQLYVVPNGDCFTCGAHADEPNAKPLGNIYKEEYMEIIKKNIAMLTYSLPDENLCKRCIKSVRASNRTIHEKLRLQVKKWIMDAESMKTMQ